MLIGLPTLRLRGDYIAIVTLAFGEIIYRFAVNGDEINVVEGYKLTNGRQAIAPVDTIDLPVLRAVRLGVQPQTVLLVRARARGARAARELPPARLAPGARLDRDPRGRGRRRVDGRAARQDEAAGLRHRRRVRRHVRRLPRRLPGVGAGRPVQVRLLDLRAGDDHPRRPGLDLGRRRSARCCCRSSTRTSSPTSSTACRARSAWTSTSRS